MFLAIAGLVMLWIKEPRSVRDVDDVAHMPRPDTEELT